jgi:hypothetical protein
MGEFDAFEAGCTGVSCKLDPHWQADTEAILSFCDSYGIGWAFFSYYSLGTPLRTPVSHSKILVVLRSEIPAASPMAVSCKPTSVAVGSSTTCKATVTGFEPTGKIAWQTSGGGKFSRASCTLSKGSCSVSYTPTASNSPVYLDAKYSGDGHNPPLSEFYMLEVTLRHS